MGILFLGIAWLVGLWVASRCDVSPWTWLAGAVLLFIASLILFRKKRAALVLAAMGVFCLGAGRAQSADIHIGAGHVARFNGETGIILTGLVDGEPRTHDRALSLAIESESITLSTGETLPVEGKVQVFAPRFPNIPYGSRVRIRGDLEEPDDLPGFDYRTYLARQEVFSQVSWAGVEIVEEGQGNPFYQAIYGIKRRAQSTINRILPDPQAALLSGILLGNEDEIPPELEEQFRISGLSHIIAISGFNIAILAAILLRGSEPFVGRRWSAWVALGGVVIYAILVGADASVVRAAIMASLFIFATRFMGRPTFAPAGLITAAVLMTAADPHVLWDVGFQLSFAATLGLMIYVDPWKAWVESGAQRIVSPALAKRFVRFLGDIFIATLAAMLFTMPLIIYHFRQLSIISPLANLMVLPAQPGVMSWGIIATVTGMVFPAAGKLLSWLVWPFLTYTISRARFFAGVPGASIPISLSAAGLVAIYALIIGLTWLGWKGRDGRAELVGRIRSGTIQRTAVTVTAILAIVTVTWTLTQPDGKLHVSFLDVGQGDATLIRTPEGRQILVDGGQYPSVLNDHLGREIPFWDRDIDILIATHPDEDHLAGLPGVLERYGVGQLIVNGQVSEAASYQALLEAATTHEVPVHHALAGETIIIDNGLVLEILNPSGPVSTTPDPQHDNDHSIVMRLVYSDFSLLLTGDAGEDAEEAMLNAGQTVSALVYKAGHHGARTSSCERFIRAVQPDFVVISAGSGNRYGHPHPEMLARAAEGGATILRTDEIGTIEIITDGEQLWWEAS